MSSVADRLRARALKKVELPEGSGCFFHIKPIVSRDMLASHKAFLLAFLPPPGEDRILMLSVEEMQAEAAKGAPEAVQALKEAEKRLRDHLLSKAADPKLQDDAWSFNIACIQAAVVGVSEGDGPMIPVQIVLDGQGDPASVPEKVPLDAFDPSTLELLSDEVRILSFGGRIGNDAITRFRGGS